MPFDNTPFFYDSERDDGYISDRERECSAVQDYFYVNDADDLTQWRAFWLPSCKVCPREPHCFPSHQMQCAKPEMIV